MIDYKNIRQIFTNKLDLFVPKQTLNKIIITCSSMENINKLNIISTPKIINNYIREIATNTTFIVSLFMYH